MISLKFIIFATIFNIILVFYYKKISNFIGIFDYPLATRKIHKNPTPLLGGFLIFFNLLVYFFNSFFLNNDLTFFSPGMLFLFLLSVFIIGLIDDYNEQHYNYKFISLSFAIFFFILVDKDLLLTNIYFESFNLTINFNYFFGYLISILCFLLFINASNMFDGINLQFSLYSFVIILIFFF